MELLQSCVNDDGKHACSRYLALVGTALPLPHGGGAIRYLSDINVTELPSCCSLKAQ